MPNWGEHILVANKLLKKFKITDINLFIFANILPDIQNGYLVKGISNIVPHKVNHFDLDDNRWGYQNFYDIYMDKMDNEAILGYWIHLLTDFYWNNSFYSKKCLKEKDEYVGYKDKYGKIIKKEKSKIREDKQKDFNIFQYWIYENNDMILPKYNSNIAQNANLIKNVNINDNDVKLSIEYIEKSKEIGKKIVNKEDLLKIYSIRELEKQIDDTVDFICKIINKNIKSLKILEN